MIRYDLKCSDGHDFDSWFASAAAYDRLVAGGHVACPDCGSREVSKALMAPAVSLQAAVRSPTDTTLGTPRDPREAALAELRRRVEENSDYVGMSFAAQARAMHEGLVPERPIHGEARMEEARKLIEDGVPVAPLPFIPTRKTN